jgi:hypothetical protein
VTTLVQRTRGALEQAILVYQGTEHAQRLETVRDRLDEPLRVAIAGRVKAGKSTLLNALVGERLAPTDAGECTRIITWYRDGHSYEVVAHPKAGEPRQLRFDRDHGALEIDLGDLEPDDVAELSVTWPSQALRTSTLIDTPGIGSLSRQTAARTWDVLTDENETPADAVLYLMRHLHPQDVQFLQAFHDAEVSRPNPVNAIAVLSRADEIGVGRLDSMASARKIAKRLNGDSRVRRVAQAVVPVAGLLAETAATLTENEVGHLRMISERSAREVEGLLLTADRFVNQMPELGLTSIERTALLERFGLFGVRLATALLRRGVVTTATELAAELADRSGVEELRAVLDSLFFERRDILKSRSALLALDWLTRTEPRDGSDKVVTAVEEIISAAHPFHELRVLSALRSGWVTGKPAVLEELEHVIGGAGGAVHDRLGLPTGADPEQVRSAAGRSLAVWQQRAESPLTDHELAIAARVAMRSCEGILADLKNESGGRS